MKPLTTKVQCIPSTSIFHFHVRFLILHKEFWLSSNIFSRSHRMGLILTQFMYLLLRIFKMIFGTKISAIYVGSFCDALLALEMLLHTVSVNWFFLPSTRRRYVRFVIISYEGHCVQRVWFMWSSTLFNYKEYCHWCGDSGCCL